MLISVPSVTVKMSASPAINVNDPRTFFQALEVQLLNSAIHENAVYKV